MIAAYSFNIYFGTLRKSFLGMLVMLFLFALKQEDQEFKASLEFETLPQKPKIIKLKETIW